MGNGPARTARLTGFLGQRLRGLKVRLTSPENVLDRYEPAFRETARRWVRRCQSGR